MTSALRPRSLLDGVEYQGLSSSSPITPLQSQVDGLVGGFVEQATDWRSLSAMMAGGMAYRVGKLGAMAAGTGRLASAAIGLGVEVSAFEMTHRSLTALTGENHLNSNLWRWEGQGGIRQGLLSSLITFGSLKGAGRLAQGENVVVQHLLQDTGMVLGHQVSAAFNITQRPTGTLAEQFLHAEATNLQLGAGMALAHHVTPGIQGIERGLDLALQSQINLTPLWKRGGRGDFAFATAGGHRRETVPEPFSQRPPILAMSAVEKEGIEASSRTSLRAPEPPSEPDRDTSPGWPPNLPEGWSKIPGSGMWTGREVSDTRQLVEAIVHDGLLPVLGEGSVDDIWGYGSYEYFRSGKSEDIRSWDADKKPDFIIVGNAREMIANLSRHWRLNWWQRWKLQSNVRYNRWGLREGFVFFNPDILVPGRGPVGFKISLIDREAFFAKRNGRAILEYVQVRLKDAHEENLLWSRDRNRALSHLEGIKDQMLDWAYLRLGQRSTFTTVDLFREFFRLSYRLEIYRFWENGTDTWRPKWDKGRKLFEERRDEIQPVLVAALRRFIDAHHNRMRVTLDGSPVDSADVQAENLYRLKFEDQAVEERGKRYRAARLFFVRLNLRGIKSYLRHAIPSNKLSQAYYRQDSKEYAGRKARNLIYRKGMDMTQVPFIARLLAFPLVRYVPIFKKVALDSTHFPVYYSNLAPLINDLYAGRAGNEAEFPQELRLGDQEYDALMGWIEHHPELTSLKNVELLSRLNSLIHSSDPYAQIGTAKLFRWISKRPLLEPKVADYIQSLSVDSMNLTLPKEFPAEISQIVEHYITYINLLVAGSQPRIYDFLRDTLRLSLGDHPERLSELLDYLDRTERGEDTGLKNTVSAHRTNTNPAFANEPIPSPSFISLELPLSVLKNRRRPAGIEKAPTLAAPLPQKSSD
jgi:hypothetical protein